MKGHSTQMPDNKVLI